jgi:serine/threonine protein kinase
VSQACPDDGRLAEWISGTYRRDDDTIQRHLTECPDCRLVADLLSRQISERPRNSDILPGDTVGPFRIEEWLGRGGMADVFRARDERLKRAVSFKVLFDSPAVNAALGEGQAMARLEHPSIAKVYEAGSLNGRAYVALEFLGGGNLRTWLSIPRSPAEILQVFIPLASALAHAHTRGVLHRDFKPENVVFSSTGEPKVTDFGLSSSKLQGGTRGYLAPEVLSGESATSAADQYAFGVTLNEAFAGTPPIALRRTVKRLMAPTPSMRWPSMLHVEEALRLRAFSVRRVVAKAALPLTVALLAVTALGQVYARSRCEPITKRYDTLLASLVARIPSDGSTMLLGDISRQLGQWRALEKNQCETRQPSNAALRACADATFQRFESLTENTAPPDLWERLATMPDVSACATSREPGDVLSASEAAAQALTESRCPNEEAVERAAQLAQKHRLPIESTLWAELAECRSRRGNLSEAEFLLGVSQTLREHLTLNSVPQLLARQRVPHVLLRIQQLDESLLEAEALVTLSDELTLPAWFRDRSSMLRAEGLLLKGRFQETAETYQSMLPRIELTYGTQHDWTRFVRHNLGSALTELGHHEAALRVFRQLLADEPGEPSTALTSDLSRAALLAGHGAEALAFGRRSLRELNDRDVRVFSQKVQQFLAWADAELEFGEPKEVLRRVELALQVKPVSQVAFDSVASIELLEAKALRRLGRWREAKLRLDRIERQYRPTQGLVRWPEELQVERAALAALSQPHSGVR